MRGNMTNPSSTLKFRSSLIAAPDGSGDCFICIPDEVMRAKNWAIGDSVDVQQLPNGTITISECSKSETAIDQEVVARAQETFGTPEKANRWLNTYHMLLGMSPIEYLDAGGSKNDILRILNAISHGGAA